MYDIGTTTRFKKTEMNSDRKKSSLYSIDVLL